jgi:hypothetical protein
MRGAFPKITSRDYAIRASQIAAIVFIILAAVQFVVAFVFLPLSSHDLFDAAATAVIFAVLALALYFWQSRIVAGVLLCLTIIAQGWKLAHGGPIGAIGWLFLVIGLWASLRSVQATVKAHGTFAPTGSNQNLTSRSDALRALFDVQMPKELLLVIVGGLLLIAAALSFGGLYTIHSIGGGNTFVLNRLTGSAWVCRPDLNWKCLPAGSESHPRAPNVFDQFDTPKK